MSLKGKINKFPYAALSPSLNLPLKIKGIKIYCLYVTL